ncbi:MAG: ABC transporter permease [Cellulosilyticaceae bacterium]
MVGIQIIKNSIKRKLYDYKTLIMISLFPLILTTIFVNVFGKIEDVDLGEMKVVIQSETTEHGAAYAQMLDQIRESGGSMIESVCITADQDGEAALKAEGGDFLVVIKEAPLKIEIVQGKGTRIEMMQIEVISQNYARQLVLGELTGGAVPTGETAWTYDKVAKQETIPITIGMTITMIVFGALLGGQYGINQMFYIKEARGRRVITAPIREGSLYIYELIASFMVLFVVTLGLVGIYSVSYDLGLEQNLVGVVGIVAALTFMAITMGVVIGMFVKSPSAGENILSLIVIVVNFTSGGFTPGVDLGLVGKLSPIRGILDVLTDMVVKGRADGTARVIASIVGICVAVLVMAFGLLRIKEKGATYGKYTKTHEA